MNFFRASPIENRPVAIYKLSIFNSRVKSLNKYQKTEFTVGRLIFFEF